MDKEVLTDAYKVADLNHNKLKFGHTVLKGFSVIEDYNICEGRDLTSHFRSEFMSIFIVTKGAGKINLNMEDIHIKENSLLHVAPNTLVSANIESQTCSVSGVSFTSDFLSEIGMPERTSEIFNYFSSKYFPVWELEAEDTNHIRNQIRLLVDCGTADFFYQINENLHDEMLFRNIPHTYVVRPGAHNWDYWREAIPYQVLFMHRFFEKAGKKK